MVTLQAPVPLHAPDQPAKSERGSGWAVNETTVPCGKLAVHVLPQSMPEGALVTLPEPAPVRETVKGNVGVAGGLTVTGFEQVTCSAPLLTCTAGA
jgi:hypothetical protein